MPKLRQLTFIDAAVLLVLGGIAPGEVMQDANIQLAVGMSPVLESLAALEDCGHIAFALTVDGKPNKRQYQITDHGRAQFNLTRARVTDELRSTISGGKFPVEAERARHQQMLALLEDRTASAGTPSVPRVKTGLNPNTGLMLTDRKPAIRSSRYRARTVKGGETARPIHQQGSDAPKKRGQQAAPAPKRREKSKV